LLPKNEGEKHYKILNGIKIDPFWQKKKKKKRKDGTPNDKKCNI
jgi:hypothetical protein